MVMYDLHTTLDQLTNDHGGGWQPRGPTLLETVSGEIKEATEATHQRHKLWRVGWVIIPC